MVAPEVNHSGAGHSLTLRRPLRTRRLSERHYAVDGTPTDCVLLALQNILEGENIDLILSGVNQGHNLGEDVTYSGTIAAAMEATLLKVPAIAFSREAPDRMLWATNWPHPGHAPKDEAMLLDTLLDWAPDPHTQRLILADNPARLYGFAKTG